MTRILLISGDIEGSESLRRKVLRFTGSRRATRAILKRVEAARRVGRIMSCMIVPRGDSTKSEDAWDVRVSFANARTGGGPNA